MAEIEWFFKKDEMKANAGSKRVFVGRDWATSDGKVVKQFGSVSSHEELLAYIRGLIARGEEACIYELVRYNQPCKLYFDVEWTGPAAADAARTVGAIAAAVDKVLQETSGAARRAPAARRCEVLQSSRPDRRPGVTKHSFHLVYPGVTFANNTVAMRRVVDKVFAQYASCGGEGACPIDVSVYSRDRLFRAPLCWKANDASRTALRPTGPACPTERLLECFVTNVGAPGVWVGGGPPLPPEPARPPPPRGQPRPRRARESASEAQLGGQRVHIGALEGKLQALVREIGGLGHVCFYRAVESAGTLLFRLEHGVGGREEPCLAHGVPTKITHRHDNQLLTVDVHGIVRIICPHRGKCTRARYTLCQLRPSFFKAAA